LIASLGCRIEVESVAGLGDRSHRLEAGARRRERCGGARTAEPARELRPRGKPPHDEQGVKASRGTYRETAREVPAAG
jgi:hypothetical protein